MRDAPVGVLHYNKSEYEFGISIGWIGGTSSTAQKVKLGSHTGLCYQFLTFLAATAALPDDPSTRKDF